MLGGLIDLPECRRKEIDDALRVYDEGRKLSNARLSSPRLLGSKDYLAGVAYLRWQEMLFHPSGHRYEASLVARRTERLSNGKRDVFEDDADIHHVLRGDDDLVFVGNVEAMDSKQRRIPSLIGLRFTRQIGSQRSCAGTDDFLLNCRFQMSPVTNDRKIASSGIPSVCGRTGGYEMIEGRSEVMGCVPDSEGKFFGQRPSASDHVTISLRHWIELGRGEVGIAVEELGGSSVQIRNVGFCPVKL